ncbi:toprim domain-containing protein [Roseomonas mucosa]|uniref:DUF7146 domain-containing protein n=1 Tax=Roseomonas mucosa TaxID=207340 RepID=UPI0028CCD490|nr:toprim domain-containing protein [Roseomonas mucosa]MDT8277703.1 toprim domain-containing protein [Roseomonas mucosa]
MISAPDLAARLRLKKFPRSWRGDCPACGYARAFSLRAGHHRPLLYCANGCDRDTLGDAAARAAGGTWEPPTRDLAAEASSRERKQAAARRLWSDAVPAAGTLADRYLAGRCLPDLATSPRLRFFADTPHPEAGRLPAMIAAVSDAAGDLVAVHRTYLDAATARKARVEPAKASLGPVWGGAVRLHAVAAELVIGEGIETAASAGKLLQLPAWAAISAGNLARGLVLPSEVRQVVIAVDPDQPGEAAAQSAVDRWTREGRKVRLLRPSGHGDFNDLLVSRVQEAPHG